MHRPEESLVSSPPVASSTEGGVREGGIFYLIKQIVLGCTHGFLKICFILRVNFIYI